MRHLNRRAAAASMALACIVASGAVRASAPLPSYEQAGLAWKTPPSPEWMGRYFPMTAHFKGHNNGWATVRCTPHANGTLACDVVDEDPGGWKFGEASLDVMRHVKVRSLDGGSPEGRTFGFTLRFGNYLPRDLPHDFQPADAGLRWVSLPNLRNWGQTGQGKGQLFSADFDCQAHATGSISCALLSVRPDSRPYARDALSAMNHARVERVDGGSPEGIRFHWRLGVLKANDCGGTGGGGSGVGRVITKTGDLPVESGPNTILHGGAQVGVVKQQGSDCRGAQVVVADDGRSH